MIRPALPGGNPAPGLPPKERTVNAAELMTKIESLVNDTSDEAAVTITEAMSKLARLVSQADYCVFCDRVFGNWG